MSLQHHGNCEPTSIPSALKRLAEQLDGRVKRAFSDGRIDPMDDGDLSYAIAIKGDTIIIDFTKPVEWIGFDVTSARSLAKMLIEKADIIEKSQTS